MNTEPIDLAKKRFLVSIYEIRQEVVFSEVFCGKYASTVTLADGTTRTVELNSTVRDGESVVEFNDTGYRTDIGMLPVRIGSQTNGNLMVQIIDLDQMKASLVSPVLPPGTALTSIAEFVPAGFQHGIEVLNDNTTPMRFVLTVLGTHLPLSPQECNATMLGIHRRGGGLIPTSSLSEAQRIAAQISAEAVSAGYPLICRAVSVSKVA